MSSSSMRSRNRGGTVRFTNKEKFLESRVQNRASDTVSYVDSTLQSVRRTHTEPPPPFNCLSVGGWCQGWRKEMEDEQVSLPGAVGEGGGVCVTVIFDGHRGAQAAQFVRTRLPNKLLHTIRTTPFPLLEQRKYKTKEIKRCDALYQERYKQVVEVFCETDKELHKAQAALQRERSESAPLNSGDHNNNNNNNNNHNNKSAEISPSTTGNTFNFHSFDFEESSGFFGAGDGSGGFSSRSRRANSHSVFHDSGFRQQRRLSTSGGFTIMGAPDNEDDMVTIDEEIGGVSDTSSPPSSSSRTSMAFPPSPSCGNGSANNNNNNNNSPLHGSSPQYGNRRRSSIRDSSGTTALSVMIEEQIITVAGLGDCEGFLVERRPDHPRTEKDDDNVSSFYGFPPTHRTSCDLVVMPTGVHVRRLCDVHRSTNKNEVRRLLYLFGPSVFYRIAPGAMPEKGFDTLEELEEAVRTTASSAKVLGVLSVTRSFGDFDLKYGGTPYLPTFPLKTAAMTDAPFKASQLSPVSLGPEEYISPLVVSNVPEVHMFKRGLIPSPNTPEEAHSYDLIVVGCDGLWERQSVVHIAQRADDALQPLLSDTETRKTNPLVWWGQVEAALKEVVRVTIHQAIAPVSRPNGTFLGGDNLSLNLTLLL